MTLPVLDALGFGPEHFVGLGCQTASENLFGVRALADVPAAVAAMPEAGNCYFSINAVSGPARDKVRGTEGDVVQVLAMAADLDIGKPGACPSMDVALAIVAEVSIAIGVRPVWITESGNGIHALWAIEDGHVHGGDIVSLRSLAHRFGRLVAHIASLHGVTNIDTVSDLSRMLRRPGSTNNKDPENPKPVTGRREPGAPISVAALDEALKEYGFDHHPDDDLLGAEVAAAPESWPAWPAQSCGYVAQMIAGWPTDAPDQRNPWHYAQSIRLESARRQGCVSEADYSAGREVLAGRLTWLVQHHGQPRALRRGEINGARFRAVGVVACKTGEQVAAELGNHRHEAPDQWMKDLAQVQPTVPAPLVADVVEDQISARMALLRIDREARRRLEIEERPPKPKPPVTSLTALLAEPDESDQYRIAEVLPEGGRTMLEAQHKAGKTTLADNLTRSLVDNDPFLGRFAVNGTVNALVRIDLEMPKKKVRRWLREQGIVNTDAVADVICLRGKVSSFNIGDPHGRREWAAQFRDLGCDFLIFDCIRPWMDAFGLDENRDAGRFIDPFNELLDDAGIENAVVVHHMGHGGERARGDSRFKDWPDAAWKLVRESDDPTSPRYFSAMGRDVQVPEGRLTLTGRRLTYSVGSRGDAATEEAYRAVVKLLVGSEPLSGRDIEEALTPPHSRKAVRDAAALGVEREAIRIEIGAKRARLHRIAHPCSRCGLPVASRASAHRSCADETGVIVE